MIMARLTEIYYRTFEELLEDVRVDLKSFALSGRIEPAPLIREALKVSYDLGLRINQTKETVLEVNHRKARLPEDFYVMNFALLCGEFLVRQTLPQGTRVFQVDSTTPDFKEFVDIPTCETDSNRSHKWPDSNKPICLTKCDTGFQLIQRVSTETRHYKFMLPIRFTNQRNLECKCPNLFWHCKDEAFIKDGFIHTNFDCGNLYISYEGALVDEDGNLLVLNKPFINSYYEYALKTKVIENLYYEGETQLQGMLQLLQAERKAARTNALSIVNTPDFQEMLDVFRRNRQAYYCKYYEPMASYPWEYTMRMYGR